jgi:FkbM family methyltransferase
VKYILSKFEINSSYPNHEEVTKSMKYLKNTFRTMQSKLPTYWAIYLVNLELKLRKLDEKISLDKSTGLFKITLSGGDFYFARKSRVSLYYRGLESRLEQLVTKYSLRELQTIKGLTHFIDCGANVGEVAYWVLKNTELQIITVEPENIENQCLLLNLENSRTLVVQGVLSDYTGTARIFHSPEDADTGLIPSKSGLPNSTVNAWRLDDLLSSIELMGASFAIKIEAEGSEPEVLNGGLSTLNEKTIFLAVDVSPERGLSQESTSEMIIHNNVISSFKLVKYVEDYSALFIKF